MHYIDVVRPDGTTATKQVKWFLGNLKQCRNRDSLFRSEKSACLVGGNFTKHELHEFGQVEVGWFVFLLNFNIE